MENDYGYKPDKTENQHQIILKFAILFIFILSTYIISNTIVMFFDFNKENGDLKTIKASKYPLKIFIEKPEIIDQVDIYEVLENNTPSIEEINLVKIEEPKKIKLEKSEELEKRIIENNEIEQKNLKKIFLPKKSIFINGFKAQIAAMSNKKRAEKYWFNLKKNHPSFLKNMKHFIQKVDFPNRDSLFRLQIIGFKDEAEVENFCLKFIHLTKQSHSNCITISTK
jgi:hypothetical protein